MSLPERVALGTMHGKAAAIGPSLARLGIDLVVPQGLDTDRFGTFTGEMPRAGTMVDAARRKAEAAMALTGLPVGLASEGAYGPHPVIPFLAQGREILFWKDSRTGHEIVETIADDAPVYEQVEIVSLATLDPFLNRIGFPRTAVVVAPAWNRNRPIAKGIQDRAALARAVSEALAEGPAHVETDMRAHLNPHRMATIARLAERFAARLATTCPDCRAPGFGRLRLAPGLPCSWCGTASNTPGGEVHGCTACGLETVVERPDGLTKADPGTCPICNP